MGFDEWMVSVVPTHKADDDSVALRSLRACWEAAQAQENERWAAISRAVMLEHGGDPSGTMVAYADLRRLVAQCQAAGARQVLHRATGA